MRGDRRDTDPQRARLVRPPRFAQGGGAAAPFGMSGAPDIATPRDQRAQDLARQFADDVRGRFTERVFRFPDVPLIAPGTQSNQSTIEIQSNRTSFVRLVALRGGIKSSSAAVPGPYDLANITLLLSINGEENFTTDGQAAVFEEFDGLFSNTSAPWFWYAAPPRLRVGDNLSATFKNTLTGEAASLQPYLLARIVDDAWWRALYGT